MIPILTYHNNKVNDWINRKSDRYYIVVSNFNDEWMWYNAEFKKIQVRDNKHNTFHIKKFYSRYNIINTFKINPNTVNEKEGIELNIKDATN